MFLKRFFARKKAEKTISSIESVSEQVPEVEATEEVLPVSETEETEAITETTVEEVPHATGKEECFDAVHKLFEEATENAMLKMPMWMRLTYFANILCREDADDKSINWDKVNRFLMLGIDRKKPYYNIHGKIKSVRQLHEATADARIAAIPDMDMPYYRKRCKQCGEMFELTLGEIESYEKKGLHIPGRCYYCRKGINRQTKEHIIPKQVEEEPVKTQMQIAMEKAGIC